MRNRISTYKDAIIILINKHTSNPSISCKKSSINLKKYFHTANSSISLKIDFP